MLWYKEKLEVKLKLLSLAVCLVLSALEASDAEGCARDGGRLLVPPEVVQKAVRDERFAVDRKC